MAVFSRASPKRCAVCGPIRPPWGSLLLPLFAGFSWTSTQWPRTLRQPTPVVAGTEHPIAFINAKMRTTQSVRAWLHVIDEGQPFLLTQPGGAANVVRVFPAENEFPQSDLIHRSRAGRWPVLGQNV